MRHPGSLLLLALSACGPARCDAPRPIEDAAMDALYASPLPAPAGPMRVFHLGHSLVGRDMPAMLHQLAGSGHRYESELGWGATLKGHWGDAPIEGFDVENAHPRYRPAGEAADSGDYDAFVMTEMVEIKDAIRYYDSWDYVHRWARRSWDADPRTRIYLYETWHPLDDPEGWLTRLDRDPRMYWEGEILRRALAFDGMDHPIYVIPTGTVLARFVREVEARGGVDGIAHASDLFSDTIHVNDLGSYLGALTHYAVLYQRSPVGLPHRLRRADGSAADAPGDAAARLMQEVVWDVVTHDPKTGIPQAPGAS
jgi:hypothetical protein